METNFVIHANDPNFEEIRNCIQNLGIPCRVLGNGDSANPGEIALFSLAEDKNIHELNLGGSSHYIRQASHRLEALGIVPKWAQSTAFVNLVTNTTDRKPRHGRGTISTFARSVSWLYDRYTNWVPNGASDAPWGHPPTEEDRLAAYNQWFLSAKKQIDGYLSVGNILSALGIEILYGEPKAEKWKAKRDLMFMGCMHLNPTRTDVEDNLDAKRILPGLEQIVSVLKEQELLGSIIFALADETMLDSPILRESLNPLLHADLTVANEYNQSLLYRKSGNHGKVSDVELAEVLKRNASVTIEDIIVPLQQATGVEIKLVSWLSILDPYLSRAEEICNKFPTLVEKIYQERAQTYFSYTRMNSMLGPKVGLQRAIANMKIYLATALWAIDNEQSGIIMDYEHDNQWMIQLEPALERIWGYSPPLYLSVPARLRQPWT